MGKICRTCLGFIDDKEYLVYNLNSAVPEGSVGYVIRTKLKACVPEISLDIVSNSVMCYSCLSKLGVAYAFKTKCLETEAKIHDYFAHAEFTEEPQNLQILEKIVNRTGPVSCATLETCKKEDKACVVIKKRHSPVKNDSERSKRQCFNQKQDVFDDDVIFVPSQTTNTVDNNLPCINTNEITLNPVLKKDCVPAVSRAELVTSASSSPNTSGNTDEVQNNLRRRFVKLIGNSDKRLFDDTCSNNVTITKHSDDSKVNVHFNAQSIKKCYLSKSSINKHRRNRRKIDSKIEHFVANNMPVTSSNIVTRPETTAAVFTCKLQDPSTSIQKQPCKLAFAVESLQKNVNKEISQPVQPLISNSNNDVLDLSSKRSFSSNNRSKTYLYIPVKNVNDKTMTNIQKILTPNNCITKPVGKVTISEVATFNNQKSIVPCTGSQKAVAPKKYLQVKSPSVLFKSVSNRSDQLLHSLKFLAAVNVDKSVKTKTEVYSRIVLNKLDNEQKNKPEIISGNSLFDSLGDAAINCTISQNTKLYDFSIKLITLSQEDLHNATGSNNLCNFCGFKSDDSEKLIDHYNSLHNDRVYNCCMCSYSNPFINNYNSHIEKAHIDRIERDFCTSKLIYVCKLCGFKTKRRINIKIHKELHFLAASKATNFNCSFCDWVSICSSELQRHLKIHWNEIFYLCNSCDAGFTNRNLFKQHIMSHDLPMRKCVQCNFQSKNISYLRNHYISEHYIRSPYKCYHCNRIYTLRVAILKHVLQLTTDDEINREIVSLEHSYASEGHSKLSEIF